MLCGRFKLLRESGTAWDSNPKALFATSLFSVPEDRHLPSGGHGTLAFRSGGCLRCVA
jgi:hypothetical protein